jgi:hypothetical protein
MRSTPESDSGYASMNENSDITAPITMKTSGLAGEPAISIVRVVSIMAAFRRRGIAVSKTSCELGSGFLHVERVFLGKTFELCIC